MKKTKRICAWLLACVMAVSLLPQAALGAETQSGATSLTVNSSKVAFAGYEWWVIGDGTSGVNWQEGLITLLAANNNFGTTTFRNMRQYQEPGYYNSYSDQYYADNPSGLDAWTTPNEYAGSTLQQYMVNIVSGFPTKEQAVITARDLTTSDGIANQGIEGQKLWAISEAEWDTINNNAVRSFASEWWLRSPFPGYGNLAYSGITSGNGKGDSYVFDESRVVARPALSLNLSSVLFTSAASTTDGKTAVSVDDGLTDMTATSGTVKFTMLDNDLTLSVDATGEKSVQTGETLSFAYSNATIGTNQYISCVLTDESGAVAYYAKLVDCSESGAESGELSISFEDVAAGTYTLQIFSEEANDYLNTDFCSNPVTMTVTVSSSALHEHSWSTEWSSDENYHWHECTAEGCTVTDNSQKDGYALHTWQDGVCSICGSTATGSGDGGSTTTGSGDGGSTTTGSGDGGSTATGSGDGGSTIAGSDTQTGDDSISTASAQTSDNSTVALWIAVMLIAGAGLTGTTLYSRKRKYSR